MDEKAAAADLMQMATMSLCRFSKPPLRMC